MAAMDSDAGLRLLGTYSQWQLISYFTLCFGFGMPYAWMMMSIVFIGDTVDYRCAVAPNTTIEDSIPYKVDNKTGNRVYEKCAMYAEPGSSNNTTVPCQYGYWFDPESGYDSTLITDWDLVCGLEWLVELSMTIQGVGTLIGAILCNWMADKYGRKNVFLGCMWSNAVLALAQAFSPNMTCYIILSFLDGIQQQGMATVCFIMAMELFPKEQRTFAGNAIEFVWSIGFMSLAGIAYALRNWRHLQIAISAPLFLTISFYWILSESVPWLVLNDRLEEADEVMHRAAKINKIHLPEHIFTSPPGEVAPKTEEKIQLLDSVNEKKAEGEAEVNQNVVAFVTGDVEVDEYEMKEDDKKYSVVDVAKSRTLCIYTLVFVFIWFVDSLGYTAISYTVTYLPGNRYINFLLYSAIEIPGYGLTWILTEKIGRRFPMVFFHFMGGCLLTATAIQNFEFEVDLTPLIITLSVLGKCMLAGGYATTYIITPEVYPTNVRNLSMGICSMFAQIAGIISPFARTLHRGIPWLPNVIIGLLYIICGLIALILPETRYRKLPTTIKEVEQWRAPIRRMSQVLEHRTGHGLLPNSAEKAKETNLKKE